jgi:signal transduction histidine kinase
MQRVTRSIQALAQGDMQAHVPEQGPDELRALATTVNRLVDQLNSLENARRQLLANLMHELGRPLGAIRSAMQALLKGAGQDRQLGTELLTGMDHETARLQRLLDDLWELHDQVLGKQELNRKQVQLEEWLAGTLSPWEAAAREKGLAWHETIAPGLSAAVIDPDRMAQAIGNVLSNAIKFTPAGGEISTTVTRVDHQLTIQVADTGPGIPLDEQEKIFQPFYRSSQSRRVAEGMGLGLSIVRDIVTAHGGEVKVESTPGEGSRFILRIPVEAPLEGLR